MGWVTCKPKLSLNLNERVLFGFVTKRVLYGEAAAGVSGQTSDHCRASVLADLSCAG